MFEFEEDTPVEEPPVLGSWSRMYVTVLIAHALLIVFFYLFSTIYA